MEANPFPDGKVARKGSGEPRRRSEENKGSCRMALASELHFDGADIVDGPNKTILAIRFFNLDDAEGRKWSSGGELILFEIQHPLWSRAEVKVQTWKTTYRSFDEFEFEGPLRGLQNRDRVVGPDLRVQGSYDTRTRKGHMTVMK